MTQYLAFLFAFLLCSAVALKGSPAGTLTPDFIGPTRGFFPSQIGGITQVEELPDRRVLVGGSFSEINRTPAPPLVRLLPDGATDPSFQADLNSFDRVTAFSRLTDGRILVAGELAGYNRVSMALLHPDGSRDESFEAPEFTGQIYAILAQPLGKFLLAGYLSTYAGEAVPGIARIHADGSLDTSFDAGTGAQDGHISTLVQHPDGRIYVGGNFTYFAGRRAGRLVRLHPEGAFDETFQVGEGFNSTVGGIHLQGNQVIVTGWFHSYRGTMAPSLVRLNSNASLDPTFGDSSFTLLSSARVTLDKENRILLAKTSGLNHSIVRLQQNGDLDLSFTPIPVGGEITLMHRTAEDRIYLSGQFHSIDGSHRARLAMLTSEYQLSDFFEPHGIDSRVTSLEIGEDGMIFAGGWFARIHAHETSGVGAIHPDGTVDTDLTATGLRNVEDFVRQPDGKIVAVGQQVLTRMEEDGRPDPTFAPATNVFQFNYFYAVTVQPDGRVIIGGRRAGSSSSPFRGGLGRLHPDGTWDTSWSVRVGASSLSSVLSLAWHPEGRILVGGNFSTVNDEPHIGFAAVKEDGTLDLDFPVTVDNAVNAILVQPDGKFLIGGKFLKVNGVSQPYLARLHADGTLDDTFDTGYGLDNEVSSLALDAEGRVIAGGSFRSVNQVPARHVARFFPDGTHDLSFQPGAGADNKGSSSVVNIHAVAVEANGDVLVGGGFDHFQDEPRLNLVRLQGTGEYEGPHLVDTPSIIAIDLEEDTHAGTIDAHLRAMSPTGSPLTWQVRRNAANGSIQLAQMEGEVDVDYTPKPGFYGTDSFLLHVTDSEGQSAAVTVRVTVRRIYRLPQLLSPPTIAGNPFPGSVLVGQVGSWRSRMGAPLMYSHHWERADDQEGHGLQTIPNATGITYQLTENDFGHYIRYVVSVRDNLPEAEELDPVAATSPWVFVRRLGPGILDSDFALSVGKLEALKNRPLEALSMPGGRILLAGEFREFQLFPFTGLVAVDRTGELDFTFDPNLNSTVSTAWVYEDGRILVGGNFSQAGTKHVNGLARFHPDGSLDESFTAPTGFWFEIRKILVQDDGKILVGGTYRAGPESPWTGLIRLLPDGTLDETFDAGGQTSLHGTAVHALAVQADGKIVAGGAFTTFGGESRSRLVRLNADGSLDPEFDIGTGFNNTVSSLLLTPDNKILVGGLFDRLNNVPVRPLVLLQENGSIDSTFVPPSFSGWDTRIQTLLAHPDGGVIAGGRLAMGMGSQARYGMVHLTEQGSVKMEFPNVFSDTSEVRTLQWLEDGQLLVGGNLLTSGRRMPGFAIVDVTEATVANPDFEYGVDGPVLALATQDNGRTWIGGRFHTVNGESRRGIARIEDNGLLDDSFASPVAADGEVSQIVPLPGGGVLIGGRFVTDGESPRQHLVRLHQDGSIDESFAPDLPGLLGVDVLLRQDDGKILVAGERESPVTGALQPYLTRLLADGAPDESFTAIAALNGSIRALGIQSDGKILVGGDFTRFGFAQANYIVRFHPNGQRDTTFEPNLQAPVNALLVLSGDAVVAGGESSISAKSLRWLESDGADVSNALPFPIPGGTVTALARHPDGRIVVAFRTETANESIIYRLHPDGLIDGSLAHRAPLTGTIHALLPDEQTILAGGDFTSFDGHVRPYLVRVTSSPFAADPEFVTEPGMVLRMPAGDWTHPVTLLLEAAPSPHTLHWSIVSPPGHGSAWAAGGGEQKEIIFQAKPPAEEVDRFFVQISNGLGGVAVYEVRVEFETSFDSWAEVYFGAEASNPAIAGPDADPTGSGFTNFASYAFGRDPLDTDRRALLAVQTHEIGNEETTETFLDLYYRRAVDADDIAYSIEGSRTLVEWQETDANTGESWTIELGVIPHGDGTETAHARSRSPVDADEQLFLRVRAVPSN